MFLDPYLRNISQITNLKTVKPIERPPVPHPVEKSINTKKTRSSSPLKSKQESESLVKGKKKYQSPSVATVSSMEYDVIVAKSKNPNIDLKCKNKWKESIPSPSEPHPKESVVEGKKNFKNVEPEVPTFPMRITTSVGLKVLSFHSGLCRNIRTKKKKRVAEIGKVELDTPSPSPSIRSSPTLRS
ncbi:hypothetical protein AMTR_s00004p00238940 [Amborella trichopoda]|uniref:Uncharacterized protein n=1 Tax=Amborella trichopoda TaxID=13333 RepID=W1NDL0_AMBTC|nr:hypothetical protein AMTR_s00004p00238940 [Amborella trichopoda]